MKPLEHNILIYDCDCPMCNLYSAAFVKTGMLDPNGRMPYDQMTESIRHTIDNDRSRNEIALVDTAQNKVIYGLDSLLLILGHNFPLVRTLFRFPPLYWVMKKIYSFISYNRKVIAPAKELNAPGSCTPDYNVPYRIAFVLLGSLFVAWILHLYFVNLPFLKNSEHLFVTEWMIALGQLLVQGILIMFIRKDRLLDYLGHNITISLIGALLLLPAIWTFRYTTEIFPFLYPGYFIVPVGVMLWQHIRRVRILGLPALLTFTWLLYRFLIAAGYVRLSASSIDLFRPL